MIKYNLMVMLSSNCTRRRLEVWSPVTEDGTVVLVFRTVLNERTWIYWKVSETCFLVANSFNSW